MMCAKFAMHRNYRSNCKVKNEKIKKWKCTSESRKIGDVTLQFLQEGETNLVFRLEELTTAAAAAVQQGEELESSGIGREWKMQNGEKDAVVSLAEK